MEFSPDLRGRVADGTITVSYRLWSTPKVKVGGTYRSGAVTIEVDEIELLPFGSIPDEDLARTGERTARASGDAPPTPARSTTTPSSTGSSSIS